jgi:hypothetical protein
MHARRSGTGHGLGWFPRLVAVAAAALAIAVVAGCDNGGAIAIDDLPASVEATFCRQSARCGGGPDPATCQAAFFLTENRSLNALVAGVKRGTIVYDSQRARQCLDEFEGSCVDGLLSPPACDESFRATVAEGGACQVSQECVSGQCSASCGDACCVGTCLPGPGRAWVGEDCSAAGSRCVTGAFCQNGKCAADLPIGAACAAGDVCRLPGQCAVIANGSGTCVAGPDQGAACSPVGQNCLRTDNYCDPVAQVCVKRKAAGSACNPPDDDCAALATCRNGVCTLPPTLGQSCQIGGCFGQLVCTDGVCVAPPAPVQCTP